MKKSSALMVSFVGVIASVSTVFAQSAQVGQVNITPLQSLLGGAQALVSQAVPFLIGLALVTFFYGLIMFLWKGKEGGDELTKSKHFMIYSILAIFVMVSIWGIIYVLQNMFGVTGVDHITYPKV